MTNPGGFQPGPGAPPGPPAPPAPGGQQFITGADLNIRIRPGDPAFPQELWGRTMGEAIRYYAIMREDFQRNNDPRRRQAPPLQGEPAPGGQPAAPTSTWSPPAPRAPAPGYTPPAAPVPTGFTAEDVQRMVREGVAEALNSSPMIASSARSVKDRLKQQLRDWPVYEAEIESELVGAPPNALVDEGTWMAAYYYVKGKRMSGAPAAPASAPGYGDLGPGSYRAANGAIYTPLPQPSQTPSPAPAPAAPPAAPAVSYFTEAPGAPPPTAWDAQPDLRNDPRVIAYARRFNMPVDEYLAWYRGKVPPPPAGGSYVA